jgi:hypothetical protein
MINYLRRATSAGTGNGLGVTVYHLRRAASIGLCTSIKYLRFSTSADVGNGLGTTFKYLRRTTSCATGNDLNSTIK